MGRAGRQLLLGHVCDFACPVVTTAALLSPLCQECGLEGEGSAGPGSCVWEGWMSLSLLPGLARAGVSKSHRDPEHAKGSHSSSRPGLTPNP